MNRHISRSSVLCRARPGERRFARTHTICRTLRFVMRVKTHGIGVDGWQRDESDDAQRYRYDYPTQTSDMRCGCNSNWNKALLKNNGKKQRYLVRISNRMFQTLRLSPRQRRLEDRHWLLAERGHLGYKKCRSHGVELAFAHGVLECRNASELYRQRPHLEAGHTLDGGGAGDEGSREGVAADKLRRRSRVGRHLPG